jgi:Cof subfamily protein (haloacid dehalogenase superfamily)
VKGLIALDIDGTITVPGRPITNEVISYLTQLAHEEWTLLIITGRTFQWAHDVLKQLPFTYYLSVQNGAITLEMPSKKIIDKKYLDKNIIPIMQQICEGEPTDFVIYSGCEYEDICYYRPKYFSEELLNYVNARSAAFGEKWQPVASFDTLALEKFPSVKCFGLHKPALEIAAQIENKLGLHVPLIRDPFNESYFVAQATHPDVSKGHALRELSKQLGNQGPIIAAGDDYNDRSMLAAAGTKVVMATAPYDMLLEADIIAPPASDNGIIEGLHAAKKQLNQE